VVVEWLTMGDAGRPDGGRSRSCGRPRQEAVVVGVGRRWGRGGELEHQRGRWWGSEIGRAVVAVRTVGSGGGVRPALALGGGIWASRSTGWDLGVECMSSWWGEICRWAAGSLEARLLRV
jgi:hypothetical protein